MIKIFINITNTTLSSPTFYLCLPNGNIIENISADIYQPKLNIKFGNISELTFSIPYYIQDHHQLILNPYISLLKNRYQIKMVYESHTEFFVIDTPTSSMTEDSDIKNITCFSLSYLLRDKLIRSFVTTTPLTATQAIVQTLSTSDWNVSHVSAQFDLLFRSFDVTSCTALDMLTQIADTYQGVLQFDTVNRTVSLYSTEELNVNRGIIFDYGKYLDKLDYSIDPDFCTRLYLTGKDSAVINSVNPCGTGYIENYTYFLDGFSRAENGTILSHSSYMSDSLCIAILNYNELIAAQTPTFNDYVTQLGLLQGDLLVLQSELTDLNSELVVIDNSLEIAATSGQSTTQLIIDKTAKELEITNKTSAITAKNSEISVVETNITNLGILLSIESNLTSSQLTELLPFVIEKETSNEYISDPAELLAWGQTEILKIIVPPINLKIDSVNFFQCLDPECITDKTKINLNGGDVITCKYSTFGLNVEAIITEIDLSFDEDTISFTVSSIKDTKTDKEKYLAILNKSMSTSTTIDANKYKFNDIETTKNDVNILLTGIQDATTRSIVGGINNSVIIDGRGISIIDPSDNNNIVRLNHSHIALSTSRGNDFKNAITPQGIIGERIIGKILLGQSLYITTGNGDFEVSTQGVTIRNTALHITGKLPDSQISSATIWNQTVSDVATALTNASTAQETADGQIQGFFQISAPTTNMYFGDIWIDIDGHNPPTTADIYRYEDASHGSQGTLAWRLTPTNAVGIVYLNAYNAQSSANNAQTTANSKIKTFYQSSTPIASTNGDFWVDTDDNNHLYRWNGSTWVTVRDQSMVQQGATYNGTVISPENGIVVTKYNTGGIKLADLTLNATEGIKIRKTSDNGVTWTDKFYLDSSGNIVMSGNFQGGTIKIGTPTSGMYPFSVDSGGNVGIGTYSGGKYPVTITSSGYLTATNCDISGTGRFNALYIGSSQVLTGNQIDGAYVLGSTITNLNASNITAGTISASRINTSGLGAEHIYQSGYPNNYISIENINGTAGLYFHSNGNRWFDIEYQGGGLSSPIVGLRLGLDVVLTNDWSHNFRIGNAAGINKPQGIWDFTDATITHFPISNTAVFG